MKLENLWSEGKGPVDYGLFLPNGQYWPIASDTPDYSLGLATAYTFSAGHAASLYITHTVSFQDQEVFAGNTSWESDGFIAVTEGNKIKWFMHLPGSEDVKSLTVVAATIIVTTDTYPISRRIEIALHDPRGIRTTTKKKNERLPNQAL